MHYATAVGYIKDRHKPSFEYFK